MSSKAPSAASDPDRRAIRDLTDIRAIERLDYEQAVPVRSTHELLARSARLHGDRPALVYLPDGGANDHPVTVSFSELLDHVNRAANALRSLGVRREDCVALLLPSMPETVIAFFAAQLAGRVCPINYMLAPDKIAELIDHSGSKVLIALGPDPDFAIWQKTEEIRRHSRVLQEVLSVGDTAGASTRNFGDLAASQPPTPSFDVEIGRDEIAAFFHTGGSTGLPKLVKHTHRNEVHVAWFSGMLYDIGPEDVVLNGFPFFHVAGSMVLAGAAIAAGAATLIPSKLGMRNKRFVEEYWTIVDRFGVTLLSGGPTFVSTIMERPVDNCSIDHVKGLFGGGSPIPRELAARFETRFGVPIRSIYGMTEAAGMVSAVPRHAERRPGASGWPLPFCEAGVFAPGENGHPDLSRPLEAGAHGAIAIRGENVTPGYTSEDITATALVGDWLITGDTGHIADDGQVFVLGRSKDVIIRGGHNIDPLVIEDALMHHPDVELCAAVGEPNRYSGELPVAFVKLKRGSSAGAADIIKEVRTHIPEPAAVPKQLYVIDQMPLTTTGKVFKPALRQMATERALLRDFEAILPNGGLADVTCNEDMGRRKVTVSLSQSAGPETRHVVSEHMAQFTFEFEIASK